MPWIVATDKFHLILERDSFFTLFLLLLSHVANHATFGRQ